MKSNSFTKIDKAKWSRKPYFDFFIQYDDPTFCLTANVDITHLMLWCKSTQSSVFLATLHLIGTAVNAVEALRTRIQSNGDVLIYDCIHIGCTILNRNKQFLFAYMDYERDLNQFVQSAGAVVEQTKKKLAFETENTALDVVHCSVLPQIHFSSVKHPIHLKHNNSIPKIVLGQILNTERKYSLPVSLQAHHALADGYHAGLFYKELKNYNDSL